MFVNIADQQPSVKVLSVQVQSLVDVCLHCVTSLTACRHRPMEHCLQEDGDPEPSVLCQAAAQCEWALIGGTVAVVI